MLLERLADCLAYRDRYAPKHDVAALQACVELPTDDMESWDDLLSQAPAAVTHRSGELRPAAWALTDGFQGMPEIAELERFFAVWRQLLDHDPDEQGLSTARQELTRPRALLIVDPAASLFDGAAQVASNGYFDRNNIPPWDTWLLVLPPLAGGSDAPCLLCWVPEWAAGWVDTGIAVNPESSLSWAKMQGEVPVVRGWGQEWESRTPVYRPRYGVPVVGEDVQRQWKQGWEAWKSRMSKLF